MLSLYLHLPFCAQKCAYCSFTAFPILEEAQRTGMMQSYLQALRQEILSAGEKLGKQQIKSIYLWGGTPNLYSPKDLISLIDTITQVFDLTDIAELNIECNPYPQADILALVSAFYRQYKDFPRIRFSFGIQSLDNEILKDTGRPSTFASLVDFLRALRPLKYDNMVFNFDFIAFGKFNLTRKGNRQLRDPVKLEFLENFSRSGLADSFSLYPMELFPGSPRQSTTPEQAISGARYGTDDDIYEEFEILKSIFLDAGYKRYEVSNFCKAGMGSIHNNVYRHMEDYLGLGVGASSYINGTRSTNTVNIHDYLQGKRDDPTKTKILSPKDILIEQFFLGLRTSAGLVDISIFKDILVDNAFDLLALYEKQWLVEIDEDTLRLTDEGMDVSNTIITELLKEI